MLRTTRLTCLIALLALSGLSYSCSSSSGGGGGGGASGTATNSGGSSNNGGSTSNNGGSTSSNAGSTNNAGSNSTAMCDPTDPTGQAAAYPAVTDCAQTECQNEYRLCLGANYANGDYSGGECEAYMECSVACDCDETCLMGCDFAGPCETCFSDTLGTCIFQNCLGAAGGDAGIPGFGTATCADLQACCDSLPSGDQATCQAYYDQVSGFGDIGCGAVITQFPTCG